MQLNPHKLLLFQTNYFNLNHNFRLINVTKTKMSNQIILLMTKIALIITKENYAFVKTNFKKIDAQVDEQKTEKTNDENEKKPLTPAEFEEYVLKSGAKGSFMVYRSKNKEDELGIDEL